jgi:hypothetical protein
MSDDSHPILTTVGLAAVALGVLMVVEPSLAAAIGVDYAAVIVVALLALVQGFRVARARQASDIQSAETPDVETVETMPTPGDDFDRTVAQLGSGPRRVRIRERANLRETLEDAAITAVADRENCSREEAVERVEQGTWTDDRHAASLLGKSGAPSPPIIERMKVAASAESTFQYRIRRTADAVARVAGVTPDEADENEENGEGEAETENGGTDDETPDDLFADLPDDSTASEQNRTESGERGQNTATGDDRNASAESDADDEQEVQA